jgi:hypothetical protein
VNRTRLEKIASRKHGEGRSKKNGSIVVEKKAICSSFSAPPGRLRYLLRFILLPFEMTPGIIPDREPERLQK